MVIVRFQLFQRTHDPVAVAGIDLRFRQLLFQHFVQLRRLKGFQVCAEAVIRRFVAELVAIGYSIHIQAGAADQEGKAAAGENPVDRFIGKPLEICHGKELPGRTDVQQVMGNAVHFFRGDLAGTQIEPAEHLTGVRGNNLPAETGSKLHTQGTFTGGVGAFDHDQLRKFFQFTIHNSQFIMKSSEYKTKHSGTLKYQRKR